MTKQIWINLPVKDLVKSKEFFTSLGFNFNTPYGNGPVSACMMIGDKGVVVMLFIVLCDFRFSNFRLQISYSLKFANL